MLYKSKGSYINNSVFCPSVFLPLYENKSYSDFSLSSENYGKICEVIDGLLRAPHREFWCHVAYNPSILKSLQSFCSKAKRPYEIQLKLYDCEEIDKELFRKYFLLILRLGTNKEIQDSEFLKDYQQLIPKIFDIPILFDIAILFSEDNFSISKLLSSVINFTSNFEEEFLHFIKFSTEYIGNKINFSSIVSHNNLDNYGFNNNELEILSSLLEFSRSWYLFLKCTKSNEKIYVILFNQDFLSFLEGLFDDFFSYFNKKLQNSDDDEKIKRIITFIFNDIIECWRLLFSSFLDKLNKKQRTSEENYELLSQILSIYHSAQSHTYFISALNLLYPFKDDESIIIQSVMEDKEQFYLDFVKNSLKDITAELKKCQIFTVKLTEEIPDNNKVINQENNLDYIIECFPQLSLNDVQTYLDYYNCREADLMDALSEGAIDVDFVKRVQEKFLDLSSFPDDLDKGLVTRDKLHIGKRQHGVSDVISSELKNKILDINTLQMEEERWNTERLPENPNRNINIYEDEYDDAYGLSHEPFILKDRVPSDGEGDVEDNEDESNRVNERSNDNCAPVFESSREKHNTQYHRNLNKKKHNYEMYSKKVQSRKDQKSQNHPTVNDNKCDNTSQFQIKSGTGNYYQNRNKHQQHNGGDRSGNINQNQQHISEETNDVQHDKNDNNSPKQQVKSGVKNNYQNRNKHQGNEGYNVRSGNKNQNQRFNSNRTYGKY